MPDTDEFSLKLLYCEFQKHEVMTMSVVGSQPKKNKKQKNKTQISVYIKQSTLNALF